MAGLAGAVWHLGPAAAWLPPVRVLLPGLSGRGRPDHVALTFDDGPSPASTPAVLAVLARLGLRATFFARGRALRAHRGLAEEVAGAGHELAVHGWDHGYLLGRGRRRVRDELARCRDLAEEVTGIVPAWFRPAYGVLTGPAVLAARELGLRPVLWTDWARDWDPRATPGSIERRLAPGVAGGHVLLLHDADPTGGRPRAATVEALPRVAELARARGLALGPLAEHGLPTRRVAR